MAPWFRDVTVADDEDLDKTILEIEIRGFVRRAFMA
jgi:hypothetical protein